MSNLSYYEMRLEMCKVAKMMWDRRLTNAAGGNFAVRVDENRILISPSLMSERKHCEMQPEDFLLIDYDRNIIEGEGKLSRESLMHVLILQNFKGPRRWRRQRRFLPAWAEAPPRWHWLMPHRAAEPLF